MTDKPPLKDKTLTEDEREANRRFQETVGRLVNTPHKPHAPLKVQPIKRGQKKKA